MVRVFGLVVVFRTSLKRLRSIKRQSRVLKPFRWTLTYYKLNQYFVRSRWFDLYLPLGRSVIWSILKMIFSPLRLNNWAVKSQIPAIQNLYFRSVFVVPKVVFLSSNEFLISWAKIYFLSKATIAIYFAAFSENFQSITVFTNFYSRWHFYFKTGFEPFMHWTNIDSLPMLISW